MKQEATRQRRKPPRESSESQAEEHVKFLQGALADRDRWSAIGECAIEKTMSVLGTKSAMLIMREAYYGTTRFDDFARRVGITKAATSARLTELVDLGLLTLRPSQEPRQRTRDEYGVT